MPIPAKYLAQFDVGQKYHVYNRTNNKELLFYSDENRRYFLSRCFGFLECAADIYCWCLLPNHFHLLIKVRSENDIISNLQKKLQPLTATESLYLQQRCGVNDLLVHEFTRIFQGYTIAINNRYNRKGNLFTRPFKRVWLQNAEHFTQSVFYIHGNPVKHRICDDFTKYKWSSWRTLVKQSGTHPVVQWFGGVDMMIREHRMQIPLRHG